MNKEDYTQQCDNLLVFFEFSHLKNIQLKEVSSKFYILSRYINAQVNSNQQKVECLKKLLEAKDCAVRAEL